METQQPAFSRQHWAGRLLRLYLGLPHLSTDPIRAWRLPTANKPAPVRNTCSRRILRCGLSICLFTELSCLTLNVNLLPPVILTLANTVSLGIPSPTPLEIGREVFPPLRSNPQFSDIYQLQNSASSTYNGDSLTLNRQMSDELAFSASYTLSK